MAKFLRRDAKRFSKFGKGKGKKATWRKPKGRDNKMREKRKGYAAVVSIGYGSKDRKEAIMVNNLRELSDVTKDDLIVIGNVGEKKKIEIAKKAVELKLTISNLNAKAFLKKIEKKNKKDKKEEENKK